MKRVLFALFILILCLFALTACGLFGGGSGGKPTLTEDMIVSDFVGATYVYSGKPIVFSDHALDVRVNGEYVSYKLFDVEYKDNVDVGEASVIITAKEENDRVKGSVTVHFSIQANDNLPCGSEDDLAALLASENVKGVQMSSQYTVPEGVTVTVPAGKALFLLSGYVFDNFGKVENYGTVVMEGAHMYKGGRCDTKFNNYGAFENHGTVDIRDYVKFNDKGTFSSDNEITSRGEIYLLDEDKSFLRNGAGGVRYVRTPVTPADLTVGDCVYEQYFSRYEPSVTAEHYGAKFSVEYANNEHVGRASATVTMEEYDPFYYGSTTVSFEITKGLASVGSYRELVALSETGDYEEFVIPALEIPQGTLFSLTAGERLRVTSTLSVQGDMRVNGEVTCRELTVSGNFTSDGSLRVTGDTFTVEGTFRNAAKGDWDFGERAVLVTGTLVNEGSVTDKIVELRNGTLRNAGEISVRCGYLLGGLFVNEGRATYLGDVTYSPDLRNGAGGTMIFSGDVHFDGEFTNEGAVINKGRVAFRENCLYSCGGTFDNVEGEVWAFGSALAGVRENYHARKRLSDDDVVLLAEYEETPYNEADQKPSFTVDGKVLSASEYTRTFYHTALGKYVQECVRVGEIVMRVSIKTDFSEYGGSAECVYSILPTSIRVKGRNRFLEATRDEGYNEIVLDEDLTIGSSVAIRAGCVLDLNGHRIRIESSRFSVYGTVRGAAAVDPLDYLPSEEAACFIVEKSAYLLNYGRIENDGLLYVKGDGSFLGNESPASGAPEGVVVNNGVIYTTTYPVRVESGGGKVFRRVSLVSVRDRILLSDVSYDGSAKEPLPEMRYHDDEVDMDRFELAYEANVNAGEAKVSMTVKDPFDPDFYGSFQLNFTIERGTAEAYDLATFKAAAANPNYGLIRLHSNLKLTENVALSAAQTLDLGEYEIRSTWTETVSFAKDCRLILSASDPVRLDRYFFAADEITLTGDMPAVTIETADGYKATLYSGYVNYNSTIVHLNGHSFVGGLSFGNDNIKNYSVVFENSSETPSVIGAQDSGEIGLNYIVCTEETTVTLRNITVYGARQSGWTDSVQSVNFTANNCDFRASSADVGTYAFANTSINMIVEGDFEDCSFSGNCAFYARTGEYSFRNCTFVSTGIYDKKENPFVSAMTFDYGGKRRFDVSIENCTLTSASGHGIEVLNRNNAVRILYDDATLNSIVVAEGKYAVFG